MITCEKKSVSTTLLAGPQLPQCIRMNPTQFGLVSSLYTPGGLLGALAAGPCATKYGRLLTMRLTTIFFTLGPVLEALAPSIWVMTVGRFISGIGAGAAIVVVPIYIAEVAPPTAKGLFGALTQIMINVGVLIAQLLGYFLSRGSLWRIVLAIAGGIGLLQMAALFLVPESPKWLADHGRSPQARTIVQKIRGVDADVEEEVDGWGTNETGGTSSEEESLLRAPDGHRQPSSKNSTSNKGDVGIFEVVFHPTHHKAIVAVVGVMFAQQLSGINSIIMYSVSLLSSLLPTTASLLIVVVSVTNLLATIAFSPLADKLGRKPCLLISIAGMGINAFLLALAILFRIKILSAVATILFVTTFAVGLGPVPFILASELVGPEAVGATQSWALAANWVATFLVAQFFPVLNSWLGGNGKVYFVFAALAVGFFAFVFWFVPETNGKKDADEVLGRERRED